MVDPDQDFRGIHTNDLGVWPTSALFAVRTSSSRARSSKPHIEVELTAEEYKTEFLPYRQSDYLAEILGPTLEEQERAKLAKREHDEKVAAEEEKELRRQQELEAEARRLKLSQFKAGFWNTGYQEGDPEVPNAHLLVDNESSFRPTMLQNMSIVEESVRALSREAVAKKIGDPAAPGKPNTQERLFAIWEALGIPSEHRQDMATRYGNPQFASKLEDVSVSLNQRFPS